MLEVFKWISELIYIPLCIYLNGATWVMNQATTIFTFHYVSI